METKEAEETNTTEVLPKEYSTFALGITKDPVTQACVLVEIGYDLQSGDVGFVKELRRGGKDEIVQYFKISAVEKGIVR